MCVCRGVFENRRDSVLRRRRKKKTRKVPFERLLGKSIGFFFLVACRTENRSETMRRNSPRPEVFDRETVFKTRPGKPLSEDTSLPGDRD